MLIRPALELAVNGADMYAQLLGDFFFRVSMLEHRLELDTARPIKLFIRPLSHSAPSLEI